MVLPLVRFKVDLSKNLDKYIVIMFRVSYNLVCPLNNTLRLNAVILQKAALHSNYQNLAPVGIVSKESLIDLLKKPNFSLIDVRNPDEVVLGMIPTALNIPRK